MTASWMRRGSCLGFTGAEAAAAETSVIKLRPNDSSRKQVMDMMDSWNDSPEQASEQAAF
ncbi:hypothetical protein [Nitrosospira sp. Is2]|uniref:hypothetical protein n=1 Tax=Nitrosospira sp. Is2 TaxID=3080532 RepID=UPI0029556E8E|nr:hypothetical protein [Nitrosospira sp. Is2]WON73582.1 hypothetical protein R5L00_14045 [Nitrosospira sp. Is2]